ncbi:MAG: TOBE domain protein [Candidatus Argoarchaeum ethanivorans]|uniref:TOBE domain protein n=1 Tax=Candidatus Argoarchaeum ethanivorans TaxID=2608793 RepID=A0A811T824_9EURY|nr:MAG: TOBE domain protein [Candidatus Argoarchaeum ethanivorans]
MECNGIKLLRIWCGVKVINNKQHANLIMVRTQAKTKLWLTNKEIPIVGEGKVKLLKTIDVEGSLNKACGKLNISYKHAWLQIKEIEHAIGETVLTTKCGGKLQGSKLTAKAKQLLKEYDSYQNLLSQTFYDKTFWEMISLKITARNQIKGTVTSIEKNEIIAKIKIEIKPAIVTAIITEEAAEALNIQNGDDVTAIIKSTEIMVGKEE